MVLIIGEHFRLLGEFSQQKRTANAKMTVLYIFVLICDKISNDDHPYIGYNSHLSIA